MYRSYTLITYGCREYLRRTGRITEGDLVFYEERPRVVMIADIQAAVASRFRIPVDEMKSERRAREVARPRQVAMYLAKRLTPKSLPEIGRLFGGRDHTTVIHAIRQIDRLRREDAELQGDIDTLTKLLGGERRGTIQ